MTDSNRPRPHRSQKAVDYSLCAGGDSDDDFADSTPPLRRTNLQKKTKSKHNSSESLRKKQKIEKKSEDKHGMPPKSGRLSLDKLNEQSFDREIQTVLELSKQESVVQAEVKPPKHKLKEVQAVVHLLVANKDAKLNGDGENQHSGAVTTSTTVPSPNCKHEPIIEILATDVIEGVRQSKRRAAASRKNMSYSNKQPSDEEDIDDEDFDISEVVDDDDSSDDGNESDYELSKSKKKYVKETKKTTLKKIKKSKDSTAKSSVSKISPAKRKYSTMKLTPPAPPAVLSNTNAISARSKAAAQDTYPTNLSATVVTIPKQIIRKQALSSPDSNPLGGVKLISPDLPRRLGLSRFARVKSLHNNLHNVQA